MSSELWYCDSLFRLHLVLWTLPKYKKYPCQEVQLAPTAGFIAWQVPTILEWHSKYCGYCTDLNKIDEWNSLTYQCTWSMFHHWHQRVELDIDLGHHEWLSQPGRYASKIQMGRCVHARPRKHWRSWRRASATPDRDSCPDGCTAQKL